MVVRQFLNSFESTNSLGDKVVAYFSTEFLQNSIRLFSALDVEKEDDDDDNDEVLVSFVVRSKLDFTLESAMV